MRLLVTGGTGFIGSHLAEAGRQRGAEVVVLTAVGCTMLIAARSKGQGSVTGVLTYLRSRRHGEAARVVEEPASTGMESSHAAA